MKLLTMYDLTFYCIKEDTKELVVYNFLTQMIGYWKDDEVHYTQLASDKEKKEIFQSVKETLDTLTLNNFKGGKGDESTN